MRHYAGAKTASHPNMTKVNDRKAASKTKYGNKVAGAALFGELRD